MYVYSFCVFLMFAVRYKGCYVDKIDRDFDDFRIDSQNLSVTFCAGQCAIKGKCHKPIRVRKENNLYNLPLTHRISIVLHVDASILNKQCRDTQRMCGCL